MIEFSEQYDILPLVEAVILAVLTLGSISLFMLTVTKLDSMTWTPGLWLG